MRGTSTYTEFDRDRHRSALEQTALLQEAIASSKLDGETQSVGPVTIMEDQLPIQSEAVNPEQVTLMIAGHYRVKEVAFDHEYGRTFVTVEPDKEHVSAATGLSTGLEKDYLVD